MARPSHPAMPADALTLHHRRARRRGVNRPVYWLVRVVLQPLLHAYFRLGRQGRRHIPRSGPVILAANHRSFLDPFVIACCTPRPVYFVAKRELFDKRWQGWILNALGAFPIRRGESDGESMRTAREILDRGDIVVIFPEGTRIRTGSLARPKRGVGRLALESGAPVVPVAVHGSERARDGWKIKPVKVEVRCGSPLTFPRVERPSPRLAAEVTERIWPCVELQWEWLGGLPPLRRAAIVGAGSMGVALAALLDRAGVEVELGCRTPAKADTIREACARGEDLRGIALPESVGVRAVSEIEFAGVDLVCFAMPARDLPQAVAQVGAQVGERTAVLLLSKGLVPPLGQQPSRYVGDRVRSRALACLGGPAHASEMVDEGASVVLASTCADLRGQLGEALERAALVVEPTADVTGTELAGCAKNAATLAAATAVEVAERGMNAAGAAAARVFAEVHKLAVASGASTETFLGLAGAGDLVATALAAHSRNRRAGELLGQGVPGAQIPALLPQAAEGISSVPMLVEALDRKGIPCPATEALCGLVEGRLDRGEWLASVRRAA